METGIVSRLLVVFCYTRMANFASSFSVNWKVVLPVILTIILLIYFVGFHGKMADKTEQFTEGGVFYRQVTKSNPSLFTLVFLHGAAFTSQNWADLGTLDYFANLDYRVVALDLPGYGKSRGVVGAPADRAHFLANVFEKLLIDRPVIVSPSMSGSFAVPFVMSDQNTAQDRLRGFIPIAPTSTSEFSREAYLNLSLPTLIIYGEKDTSLGIQSLENLKNIPGSIVHMMKGASHPCYLYNPEEFHSTVLQFLERLE